MKIFIVSVLAVVLADPIVDKINSNPKSTWHARDYPPEIINTAKVRAMCGTKVSEGGEPAPLDRNDLPVEFDSRERWPGKLQPIRDQGHCGSCWAHAVAETAEHRLSIQGCDVGRISP
jgi:C1A family cysteine protease